MLFQFIHFYFVLFLMLFLQFPCEKRLLNSTFSYVRMHFLHIPEIFFNHSSNDFLQNLLLIGHHMVIDLMILFILRKMTYVKFEENDIWNIVVAPFKKYVKKMHSVFSRISNLETSYDKYKLKAFQTTYCLNHADLEIIYIQFYSYW